MGLGESRACGQSTEHPALVVPVIEPGRTKHRGRRCVRVVFLLEKQRQLDPHSTGCRAEALQTRDE
jgi:hypothetical protein